MDDKRKARLLAAHEGDNPWHIIDCMTAPDPAFGGRSMIQILDEGDDEAIDRYIRRKKGDGFS